jgi:site-specific DNA recombinase
MTAAAAPSRSKVAGYVRVSTETQAERGESLEVQEARLRAEADRRGYALELYREAGVSAKDGNRPAYKRMLAALRAGRLAAVMATRLDRLWRNLSLAVRDVDTITRECGGDLIVLDQQFDTTTAAGRAMLHLLLTFGQFEREATVERVTEVMLARARDGRFNGGPVPYGYRVDDKRLVVDKAEAAVVRRIFDLLLQTGYVRQVRVALNSAGLRTRRGVRWTCVTVRRILSSPVYAGDLVYNRRTTRTGKARPQSPELHVRRPGVVPPIVSRETFDRVQAVLAPRPRLAPRTQSANFLLGGLVRCAHCKHPMYGHSARRQRRTSGRRKRAGAPRPAWLAEVQADCDEILRTHDVYHRLRYHRCTSATRLGPDVCPGNSVRAEPLETKVLEALLALRTDPGRVRALESEWQAARRKEVPALRREAARLQGQLAVLAERDDRVMTAFEEGTYDAAVMQRRRRAIGEERDRVAASLESVRGRIAAAQRAVVDAERLSALLRTAYDCFDRLSFDSRRAFLHALIDHIVVGKAGGTIVLRDDLAETTAGLFREAGGRREFALDAARVSMARAQCLDVVERRDPAPAYVRQRMGTHTLPKISTDPPGCATRSAWCRTRPLPGGCGRNGDGHGLRRSSSPGGLACSPDLIYRWEREYNGPSPRTLDRPRRSPPPSLS